MSSCRMSMIFGIVSRSDLGQLKRASPGTTARHCVIDHNPHERLMAGWCCCMPDFCSISIP